MAAHLKIIHGTLVRRGTPVEKHWFRELNHLMTTRPEEKGAYKGHLRRQRISSTKGKGFLTYSSLII